MVCVCVNFQTQFVFGYFSVPPTLAGMSFRATDQNGNTVTRTNGQTLDVIENSPFTITAEVTGTRGAPTITFNTNGLIPNNAGSIGANTPGTADANGIIGATRTYTFTPDDLNTGDTLSFTATNNANPNPPVDGATSCTAVPTATVTLNVLGKYSLRTEDWVINYTLEIDLLRF